MDNPLTGQPTNEVTARLLDPTLPLDPATFYVIKRGDKIERHTYEPARSE